MPVTTHEELLGVMDQLAHLSSKLGILKGAAEDLGSDNASDSIEGAQDYVDNAIRDLRTAVRDLENEGLDKA